MNKIAFLNDGLRRTFARGKVVTPAGVAALPEEALAQVLDRVRHFDEFTKDNDPYCEHDFGSFEVGGVSYFSRSIITPPICKVGRMTPPIPTRRRGCLPSCAQTSTDFHKLNRFDLSGSAAMLPLEMQPRHFCARGLFLRSGAAPSQR
jgi:hypothetical protein